MHWVSSLWLLLLSCFTEVWNLTGMVTGKTASLMGNNYLVIGWWTSSGSSMLKVWANIRVIILAIINMNSRFSPMNSSCLLLQELLLPSIMSVINLATGLWVDIGYMLQMGLFFKNKHIFLCYDISNVRHRIVHIHVLITSILIVLLCTFQYILNLVSYLRLLIQLLHFTGLLSQLFLSIVL